MNVLRKYRIMKMPYSAHILDNTYYFAFSSVYKKKTRIVFRQKNRCLTLLGLKMSLIQLLIKGK